MASGRMEEDETEVCVSVGERCLYVDPRYWGEKVEGVGEDSGSWSDDHLRLVESEQKSRRLIRSEAAEERDNLVTSSTEGGSPPRQ